MLKTELEIVTVGTPDIAMLSENEQRIFFETILKTNNGFSLKRYLKEF